MWFPPSLGGIETLSRVSSSFVSYFILCVIMWAGDWIRPSYFVLTALRVIATFVSILFYCEPLRQLVIIVNDVLQ